MGHTKDGKKKPRNNYKKADWMGFATRLMCFFSLLTTCHALNGFHGPLDEASSRAMREEKKNLPDAYPNWARVKAHYEHSNIGMVSQGLTEGDDREMIFRAGLRYASLGTIPRGVPKRRIPCSAAKNHTPNAGTYDPGQIKLMHRLMQVNEAAPQGQSDARRNFQVDVQAEKRALLEEKIKETDWCSSGCEKGFKLLAEMEGKKGPAEATPPWLDPAKNKFLFDNKDKAEHYADMMKNQPRAPRWLYEGYDRISRRLLPMFEVYPGISEEEEWCDGAADTTDLPPVLTGPGVTGQPANSNPSGKAEEARAKNGNKKRRINKPQGLIPVRFFAGTPSMTDLDVAITNARSKASPGPDAVSMIMLKKIPALARRALLSVFSYTKATADLPKNWKRALIRPVPKPGKDRHRREGYRPVALTSSIAKLAESTIAVPLLKKLAPNPCQTAYKKGRSTEDALA